MAGKHGNGAAELHDAAVLHSLSLGGERQRRQRETPQRWYPGAAKSARDHSDAQSTHIPAPPLG